MGADTGVFWLRDSLFAATPYASIGLAVGGFEFEPKECIAISAVAVRKVVSVLRSKSARFIQRIEVERGCQDDLVYFVIIYDEDSEYKDGVVVSRYTHAWLPQITPREHCERLFAYRPRFDCVLPIEEMLSRLRDHEGVWSFSGVYGTCEFDIRSGYVALEESSNAVTYVTVSRSLLLAFLDAAKDEDTTFRFRYYGDQRTIVCSAGDVVGVLSVIG
jgi:hypothetical protein